MVCSRIIVQLSVVAGLLLGCAGMVQAEPMFAPTLREALAYPFIVIASYKGYVQPPKGTSQERICMNGVPATFHVEKVLKADTTSKLRSGSDITVQYAFHDGSACMPEPGFKLDPKVMPAVNSRWILFLSYDQTYKVYGTYRGDFGRFPATADNLKKVQSGD